MTTTTKPSPRPPSSRNNVFEQLYRKAMTQQQMRIFRTKEETEYEKNKD